MSPKIMYLLFSMMQSGGKIEYNGDTNNKLMQEKTEKVTLQSPKGYAKIKLSSSYRKTHLFHKLVATFYLVLTLWMYVCLYTTWDHTSGHVR